MFLVDYFHVSVSFAGFGEVGDFCVDLYAVVAIAFVSKGNNYCFFLCTVYAGMLPSFVKQHFWTVKFLDLRACESLFMQVQYTGKILFHDLTGGMVEFPPLWNYYMYWEGFVDSLLISCNVYHVKLYVCFFC